jgi:hypothetical protein
VTDESEKRLVIENAYGIRLCGHEINTGYESKCRRGAYGTLGTMRRGRDAAFGVIYDVVT